jgi:hypothetical protein
MAEFCKQCADELGFPESDFKGACKEIELDEDVGFVVVCEGCGFVLVDHLGQCMGNSGCLKKHETPKKVYRRWEEIEEERKGE